MYSNVAIIPLQPRHAVLSVNGPFLPNEPAVSREEGPLCSFERSVRPAIIWLYIDQEFDERIWLSEALLVLSGHCNRNLSRFP